jgi:L-ribulokinase
MVSLKPLQYDPLPENQKVYEQLFALYRQLHDAFGGVNRKADLSSVMKELIRIREEQTRGE